MGINFVSYADKIRSKVVDLVAARMEQMGAQAVSIAKELVPKDTHQTEDSIAYIWSRQTMTMTLYADTSWSIFLEMGTSRMAPRPFLRPAIMQVGRQFGGTAEIQFPTAPARYQAGYRKQAEHHKRVKTVIGHRHHR